jgi:glycosyltransferase involved in cell wall biosynthesis
MASDEGVTPTQWQAGCFPDELRKRLQVIHDGIQTDKIKPDRGSWVTLGREQHKLRFGDELVTFVNRNLEPMRGFHQFMRAVPEILSRRPNARVVIVGGNDVSYGARPPKGQTYKDIYMSEVKDRLDFSRVHFVNRVPYSVLINLFNVSAVHVYLTVPFVLSWSMMEAMSAGALMVASDTAPVNEVISHGENGLLVDFFRPDLLAQTIVQCLENPKSHENLRIAARQTIVQGYDFKSVCLPKYLSWLDA